ncbi:TPA: BREX system P-loop protein BrxC, partial [Candidatus Scatousia excrementigallinarum]|nr:BREX system P-loop protein BrxC [Candidatus Scatousia excrementigallinarum]
MIIRDMFQDDINRQINGVIKVDQSAEDVVRQEVKEYIITRELKKHIITFFNFYDDSFTKPTADIGVWISGFFGSGKSHFLKMLSYILSNKKIGDISTVEAFRSKFEDDPATFMLIDNATKNLTETILFNIDVEGPLNKDKTAVIRVFAKMFYNHLGFYGEDLKVAKLEQFIEKQGKTAQFRESFKKHNGGEWLESRASYNFFEDDVVATLQEVLGMSESAARNWFDGTETAEISIAQLVSEIKEYVSTKPKDFRLLFMIDEVGQYIGEDTNLLLNLQSLVEELGSVCMGQVWVVCTGQEAVDEIIRVRQDEFSRIQARFKTRLSLTSSSVDEVVQKRILKKKAEAVPVLEEVYGRNDSVLKNLFTFTDCVLDIKGYSGPNDFVINYPFVPYQFIVMQKVFNEIRKHGNAGRHQSNGERSMLSGFQETAQRLQDRDESTLAPFYMFYDTLHSFLDGAIRRVIERCEKAAVNGDGIEKYDVSVLKLLYLIRYIDNDIKSTMDNITILMADNINVDKIALREKVCASLDRLLSQNYIGRSGDSYNFLTDEEQDIQKDIQREQVDTSALVTRIGQMIYGDIYTSKKYRYDKKYDFAFDSYVDGISIGTPSNNMQIKFLTVATDPTDKTELRLRTQSSKQITAVLADTPYYSSLESAMKIRNYVKRRNVSQMPKSMQDIIRGKQDEATNYENEAMAALRKAIEEADFYVDGEKLQIRGGDAKSRIDQAFEYLVEHVYSELTLIEKNYEFDSEIREILTGQGQQDMVPPNSSAAAKVEEFLEMQQVRHLPTSMADIQSRYQAIPYGWREIDIAAVVALLIRNQKVTIKYSGMTIQPDHPKLVDMLRKRTEMGKTLISKRLVVAEQSMKRVKSFLREYFDKMDVPSDEDGLIKFINESFTAQLEHYRAMYTRFQGHNYPNKQ